MKNVALDVVNFLTGDSVLGLTENVNLWWGSMLEVGPRVPTNAVFLEALPGVEPTRTMGQTEDIKWPMLAVRVRAGTNQAAYTRIAAIIDFLQGAKINGYLDLRCLNSAPLHLGPDAEGHHLYLSQFGLTYTDPA